MIKYNANYMAKLNVNTYVCKKYIYMAHKIWMKKLAFFLSSRLYREMSNIAALVLTLGIKQSQNFQQSDRLNNFLAIKLKNNIVQINEIICWLFHHFR